MARVLSLIALLLIPSVALAEERPCYPAQDLTNLLASQFSEHLVSTGTMMDGQALFSVFATDDGKTWTAVVVRAEDGFACIVAHGQDWQTRRPEAPEEGV